MLATLVRRAASSARAPLTIYTNPYKTKKVWPPDFAQLSPQEQFRYEKRYKRRVKLLAERPRWTKFVKLAQLFSVSFIVVYLVLFMDWGDEGHEPFAMVRGPFWRAIESLQRSEQREKPPAAAATATAAVAAAAATAATAKATK